MLDSFILTSILLMTPVFLHGQISVPPEGESIETSQISISVSFRVEQFTVNIFLAFTSKICRISKI